MAWIDIAILAVVVLFGVLGVLRGVKKSALSLGAFVIAFILAFFLSTVIAEALLGIDGLKLLILGDGSFNGETFSIASLIYAGVGENYGGYSLTDSYVGVHFYAPIVEIIKSSTIQYGNLSEGMCLSIYLAFIMLSAIVGVVIFIIVRFLLMIVTAIIKSYIGKKKSIGQRFGGFFVAALQGGIVAFVATLIFTCFGGLTAIPVFGVVENEFESPNAVVCNYVYTGAYAVRDTLFLPNVGTYGRIVSLVADADYVPPEDNTEKLQGARLEMFIAVSNLNYENDPWIVDKDTKSRKFDAENANPYKADEFKKVGLDKVMQAILDYNTAAAAKIDDLEQLAGTNFSAYQNMINGTSNSINKTMKELVDEMRAYIADYDSRAFKVEDEEKSELQLDLNKGYNSIQQKLETLSGLYADLDALFDDAPDFQSIMPECVKVTDPIEAPEPDVSDEDNGDKGNDEGDGEDKGEDKGEDEGGPGPNPDDGEEKGNPDEGGEE